MKRNDKRGIVEITYNNGEVLQHFYKSFRKIMRINSVNDSMGGGEGFTFPFSFLVVGITIGVCDGVEVPESSIFNGLLGLCKITEINSFYLVDKL